MSSASRLRTILVWLTALIIFGLLPLEARRAQISLEPAETITGWWLFGLMIFLALFNARKKLSMVPLGNAATWLLLHAVGGVLALVVYWLHTRNLWPIGSYEQLLAVLFYATVLTGVFGYLIQRFYPNRLTQTGMEIIYERIPREISELRQRAEELVLECTEKTGSETLGRHYVDSLAWYFRQPRFFRNHIVGSQRGAHWLRQQDSTVRRYLSDDEKVYLDELTALAEYKNGVDIHYALQGIMKRWLLLHVPLTMGLLAMAVWHLLIVHIYSL